MGFSMNLLVGGSVTASLSKIQAHQYGMQSQDWQSCDRWVERRSLTVLQEFKIFFTAIFELSVRHARLRWSQEND